MKQGIVAFAMWSLVLFSAFFLPGCATDSDEVIITANRAGITEVQPLGLSLMSCGQDDKMGRAFIGKNAQGVLVDGVVCCGVFKRCTIRW